MCSGADAAVEMDAPVVQILPGRYSHVQLPSRRETLKWPRVALNGARGFSGHSRPFAFRAVESPGPCAPFKAIRGHLTVPGRELEVRVSPMNILNDRHIRLDGGIRP